MALIQVPLVDATMGEALVSVSGRARRLFEGWSANLLQLGLGITQQVALIPVFLYFWTSDVLAAWLAIYAAGNLILVADAGLQFRTLNRFLLVQIERRQRWPHRPLLRRDAAGLFRPGRLADRSGAGRNAASASFGAAGISGDAEFRRGLHRHDRRHAADAAFQPRVRAVSCARLLWPRRVAAVRGRC